MSKFAIVYDAKKKPHRCLDEMIPAEDLRPHFRYVPICGYVFVMMVTSDDMPIGFVRVEDLGFDSVKEWMDANPAED